MIPETHKTAAHEILSPYGDRINKLPRWAQDLIKRLERTSNESEERLARALWDLEGITAKPIGWANEPFYPLTETARPVLWQGEALTLELPSGPLHRRQFEVRVQDDHIVIRGCAGLRIAPEVSNVIRVYLPD